MTIKVTIETDNDAFAHPHGPGEVVRILRNLAIEIEDTQLYIPCIVRDINGNTVGAMEVDL